MSLRRCAREAASEEGVLWLAWAVNALASCSSIYDRGMHFSSCEMWLRAPLLQTSGLTILSGYIARSVLEVSWHHVQISLTQRGAGAFGRNRTGCSFCKQTADTCGSQNFFFISEALERSRQVDRRFDRRVTLWHVRLQHTNDNIATAAARKCMSTTCSCTDVSDRVCRAEAKSRYLLRCVTVRHAHVIPAYMLWHKVSSAAAWPSIVALMAVVASSAAAVICAHSAAETAAFSVAS
jgi:hypothetical protein